VKLLNVKSRHVEQLVRAIPVTEGAGVTVHRTIGTPELRNLDPFLMLDHFSSDNPDDYIAGFPDHPHRGFNTFTYMIDGHMEHQDSMGNHGDLRSGGAQWMKAASGVIHSEMPQQTNGLMRGFQLWVNLPQKQKMSAPGYQEFQPESFPVINTAQANVKLIVGEYGDQQSPIKDQYTKVQYIDVTIAPNAEFSHEIDSSLQGFVYLFEGEANIASTQLLPHNFATLSEGDVVAVTAGENGARLIMVAGLPLKEPIVQHGPFVMNTQEEIKQAFKDYQQGTLVQGKASFVSA
jgi:redox-sensitive bicupin YhaK (pirin superfamily)